MRDCLLKHSAVLFISFGFLITSASFGAVPVAFDDMALLTDPEPLLIPLTAEDDGQPDPPGSLAYVINTLPQHGRLFDTVAGEITEAPYVLFDPATQVLYEPCPYYQSGTDSFQFSVDDGGTDPNGGFSNTATITIEIDLTMMREIGSAGSQDYYLLYTNYRDMRTQAIYYPDELAGEQTITDLAINVSAAPGQVLNNWTIRMKHTTQDFFPRLHYAFDEEDWSLVYDANELIETAGWHNFHLDTPFAYNGIDNLLVEFSFHNDSTSSSGYIRTTHSPTAETGTARVLTKAYNTTSSGFPSKTSHLPDLQLKSSDGSVVNPLAADFNYDCFVDMLDLEALAAAWLSQAGDEDYSDTVDVSVTDDDLINLADFAVLAGEWMQSGF